MSGLFDLTGRVALVTGSSRGIGNALARALADAGATVVLNGINPERLKAAEAAMAADYAPGRVHSCAFDVTGDTEAARGISLGGGERRAAGDPGQQRRDPAPRPDARARRRGLGTGDRHGPDQRVPGRPRGGRGT